MIGMPHDYGHLIL